jgi:U3 small nucleolar RNA-associated protein MPP10
MELQDSASKKSLAEVYEDEFRDARDREQGKEVINELDKDLVNKHEEIEALFEDLASRLDALSNARFTPKAVRPLPSFLSFLFFFLKRRLTVPPFFLTSPLPSTAAPHLQPKATITTVSNLPSISLESALPTTNSTSTLMAPEEV